MGIEARFDLQALEKYVAERKERLDTLIMRRLNYLGMQCVTIAKSMNTYVDRTANLRNSIGYVIVKNGEVAQTKFSNDGRGVDFNPSTDQKGEVVGKEFAISLSENFDSGYVLIVVAGMHYASYVENVHHLDVLSTAENFAKNEMKNVIEKIMKAMEKSAK